MAAKVKLKSHRGAAKRFRRRATGVKFRHANRNHILTKKRAKVKLQARAQTAVKGCDKNAIDRLLDGS